jgi:hypothetical protein
MLLEVKFGALFSGLLQRTLALGNPVDSPLLGRFVGV